jgi:C-terminal processing protease CtpA/Prc
VIDLYEALYKNVSAAYRENRGRTGPVPLRGPGMTRTPATDRDGKVIAYTKPLMVIIDEFSSSTADAVPAMLQDARRAILFGMRTNGAGETNTSLPAGAYSEGTAGMTLGLMTRSAPVATPDYPTTHYIENVGVRPDIEADHMTRDNLLEHGRPFVEAFTQAMVDHIRRSGN